MFRLIAIAAIFFISGCATQMTADDYKSIKKVAVVTSVKNELLTYSRGLTIFGNSANKSDISEWKLSEYLLDKAVDNVSKKHPTIQFTKLAAVSLENRPEFYKKLQSDGYDALLEVGNAGIYTPAGGGSYILPPDAGGFIIFSTSFMGKSIRNSICVQIDYALINLANLQYWAYSTNSSELPKEPTNIELKQFNEYSLDEKLTIKNELIKNIDIFSEKLANELIKIKKEQRGS